MKLTRFLNYVCLQKAMSLGSEVRFHLNEKDIPEEFATVSEFKFSIFLGG